MARKRYTAEELIGHFRTIEIELGKGLAMVVACRKLSSTEHTYDRWKKEYGGLRVDQTKCLKGLEQENARLKRVVVSKSTPDRIWLVFFRKASVGSLRNSGFEPCPKVKKHTDAGPQVCIFLAQIWLSSFD